MGAERVLHMSAKWDTRWGSGISNGLVGLVGYPMGKWDIRWVSGISNGLVGYPMGKWDTRA